METMLSLCVPVYVWSDIAALLGLVNQSVECWMWHLVLLTCPLSPACVDVSGYCAYWKSQGACTPTDAYKNGVNFVSALCPMTCGLCGKLGTIKLEIHITDLAQPVDYREDTECIWCECVGSLLQFWDVLYIVLNLPEAMLQYTANNMQFPQIQTFPCVNRCLAYLCPWVGHMLH